MNLSLLSRLPYEKWMEAVDHYVEKACGQSIHDLDDCPFREWYDRNMSARVASAKAIKLAKKASGM